MEKLLFSPFLRTLIIALASGANVHSPFSLSLLCSHNDLPWNIRKFVHNELETVNFTHNLKYVEPWSKSPWSHTDIMRLADGMVGCQVSKVYRARLSCHSRVTRMSFHECESLYRVGK